jgi:PAS domain S-box-containing protein
VPKTGNLLSMPEELKNHLEFAIALANPDSNQIVEYNSKFFQRCIDIDGTNDENTDISIATALPSLNLSLMQKVLARNRKHRYRETFTKYGIAHPVDFTISTIELSNKHYILIQGADNNYELELENMVSSYRQIIESKSLEINLEKQLEMLNVELVIANEHAQLIDTANAPIFGVDTQGKINEWNLQSEKITGFSKKEVMGLDLVSEFIAGDHKVAVGDVLAKALNGEETVNFEFSLFSKYGSRVDIVTNSATRRDAAGKVIGVVGVGQDITELNQVRVEQEKERKEATAQIIQSSKLATLGEMATSVAHELNQPLNVIRMAAGNSRRKISKGTVDPEYLNDKLERIEAQTARAAAIIDHMRMFGRKANEEPEPVNPRAVVANALDLIGEQLRLAGIEIVTKFSEDCPSVLGHRIQMEQVILNLLTNARDAMAENEGEKKITLRVFEDDKGVHISSEDAGVGIPEDVLPRIFEPFYTSKEMGKGTGLGLSVSYGIINDMNGIIVADNINGGARFTITLPSVS